MKTLLTLKLLLISAMLIGSVHAARLSDEDKTDVRRQLDELIQETKGGDGFVQMDKFNVVAFQSLEEFHVNRKITREELLKFKQELEGIRVKVAPKDREAQIRSLFDKNLLAVDSNKKDLIKEGGICNHWDCSEGLTCAPVPPRVELGANLKSGDQFCSSDSECSSGECYEGDDGKKRCEFTYRCFRPVAEGKSCLENPVCGKGSCSEVFFSDANIGACEKNGVSCKSNLDCCSDSCVKGVCAENYTCQDCIKSGKLSRGQKCCADESVERNGQCVPLVVPLNPFVQVLESVIDLVFPRAHALREMRDNDEGGGGSSGGGRRSSGANPDQEYRSRAQQDASFRQGQGLNSDQTDSAGMGQMGTLTIATNTPSNFETCEINLINDYAKRLSEGRMPGNANVSMLEVELALLGFEYVAGGNNQIQDYWKGGPDNKTLHERIKVIAKKRADLRLAFMDDLRWFEPKIKCLCLEKTGYKQMSETQREEYENECRIGLAIPPLQGGTPEDIQRFRETRDQKANELAKSPQEWNEHIAELKRQLENNEIEEGDDALGMKALELLEAWAAANATIEEVSLVISNIAMDDLDQVHQWMVGEAAWNNPDRNSVRRNKIYKFEIKNQSSFPDPMMAIALLSAGVVAILGGFAFASTVSAWVTAGVIASAAASVGAGMWMISSLRGAWYSTSPYVQDTNTGSYKCGKSDTCMTYDRYVYQPYNSVCNKHISANACIKHFMVEKSDPQNSVMIIDPWIPQGMGINDVVKDTRDFASLLDQGWNRAYDQMKRDIPYPTNFNSKAASSVYAWVQAGNTPRYADSILTTTTITNKTLGKYAPSLRSDVENSYVVPASLKERIITGAAEFLKQQGWSTADVDANAFGNYVYRNHFIWPKTTLSDVMAYPQPGFVAYVGLIANGLATNMDFSASVAGGFRQLQQSYQREITRRGGDFNTGGQRVTIGGRPNEGTRTDLNGDGGSGNGVGFTDFGGISGFGSSTMAGMNSNGGILSGSAFGNGNFDSSLFSNGVNAALSNLRDFRNRQKEAADKFKKDAGDSARGKRLIEKAAEFRDQFYADSNGSGSGSGSDGLLGSGSGGNLLGKNGNFGSTNLGSNANGGNGANGSGGSSFFGEGIGRAGNGGAAAAGAGAGGAAGYGFGEDYNNGSAAGAYGANGAGANGSGTGSNGISPEEARRLSDAVRSRDGSDKDKYQRQDGMSLWEIVTNTYIRVYDRLLERKNNSLD